MSKRIINIGFIVLSIILGIFLLREISVFHSVVVDYLYCGSCLLPLTNLLFHKFNDRGYLFLRLLGWQLLVTSCGCFLL